MVSPVNQSQQNTINALTNFSNNSRKVYLKIEYTSQGEPFLKTVDRFGLIDLIQWYFTRRFDLDKVVQVCSGILTDSRMWDKKENQIKALKNLNEKIKKHNKNHTSQIDPLKIPRPAPLQRSRRVTPQRVQGISNAGNTCYINSTVQALRACESFKQILVNRADLGNAFAHVFRKIESDSEPLDGRSVEMNSLRRAFNAIGFLDAFSGREEDPDTLLFPILNSFNFRAVQEDSPFPYPHISLRLDVENSSINAILNRLEIALKTPSEDFLPIFISRHDERGNKLFNSVVPDRLITVGNDQYSLKSVIIHHGTGSAQGHYTAAMPIPNSQDWIHYNDSVVTRGGEDLNRLICQNATLYFYEKVNQ